ncbi:TPA: HD domain-containing protein [Candidatus Avacholeplasma faecigallinarum]|nr:HD domain-containing protein [Candidatus Avacholeplasma faecigallinarum]
MLNEFLRLIRPIVKTSKYRLMKNYRHHNNCSTYSHSLKVAYLCYTYALKHKNIDLKSLIRGALLHDYYLYDWHDKESWHRLHGYKHPKFSYQNAIKDYENINKIEKDIILHHMFPLTINPPKTKEGWIVCYFDKVASFLDYKKRKGSH